MKSELPLRVEMPLGFDPAYDFSQFIGAFRLENPYGLKAPVTGGEEPQLSHAITVSTKATDPASRLHSIVRGRLRFVPPTSGQSAQLELQPLPFTIVAMSRRLRGSGAPKLVIYGNIEQSSVVEASTALLQSQNLDPAKRIEQQDAFLAGTRWLTVSAGDYIGSASQGAAPAGFRTLDLSMKDQDDYFVNPAHYLYQFPTINDKLAGHPLIEALRLGQEDMRLATKSKKRYVAQTSKNADGKFLTPTTASTKIQPAIDAAEPGDVVIVLDTSTYAESINMKNGVQLVSLSSMDLPKPPDESASLPKLNLPAGTKGRVIYFDALSNSTLVSGFRIEGGDLAPGDGGGIYIRGALGVEVTKCHISSNRAFRGGGIGVENSRNIFIAHNLVEKNSARGSVTFDGILKNRGQGGGIFIAQSTSVQIRSNILNENEAENFGGGIGVLGSTSVAIYGNEIGDVIRAVGNRVTEESPSFYSFIVQQNPRGGGGGIGIARSEAFITGNSLFYNKSSRGGGIEFYGASHGLIHNNVIKFNSTRPSSDQLGGDGGGIAINPISTTAEEVLETRRIDITNNIIQRNSAGDDGGGLYGTTRAMLWLEDNEVSFNTAEFNGGGIRISFGAELTLSGGKIQNNTCNLGDKKGGGGGIAVLNAGVYVEGCTIEGNTANNFGGGGVYGVSSDYDDPFSEIAGVFGFSFEDLLAKFGFDQTLLTLVRCKIPDNSALRNSATAGGGLYIAYRFYPFGLYVKDTFLGGNINSHNLPAKSFDVVIESTDPRVEPPVITSPQTDTQLQALQPLKEYKRVFMLP